MDLGLPKLGGEGVASDASRLFIPALDYSDYPPSLLGASAWAGHDLDRSWLSYSLDAANQPTISDVGPHERLDFGSSESDFYDTLSSQIFRISFNLICSPFLGDGMHLIGEGGEYQLSAEEELCVGISAYVAWGVSNLGVLLTITWAAVVLYGALRNWLRLIPAVRKLYRANNELEFEPISPWRLSSKYSRRLQQRKGRDATGSRLESLRRHIRSISLFGLRRSSKWREPIGNVEANKPHLDASNRKLAERRGVPLLSIETPCPSTLFTDKDKEILQVIIVAASTT
mmetsp:Transcript_9962/g.36421  ORF Transcript_9962/g.36421 Transcript_9962/m.36421 type:complete len:286 (+) Transcript_9962:144-1001(+)